jgi:TRAP-type C4-dicarboxylate transport system substrate-binding protein
MGFVPTSLPLTEIYTALSLGTIDAAWTSIESMDSMGITALTPYVLETPAVGGVDSNIMVNADVWKTVPPDLQQAFIAACKEYGPIHTNIQYSGYVHAQAILKAKKIQKQVWPDADWAQAEKFAQQLWTQYDNSTDKNTVQAIKIVRDYFAMKDAGILYPTASPTATATTPAK